MNYLDIVSVPAIASVVYALGKLIRLAFKNKSVADRFLPLISLAIGVVCGIVVFYALPSIIPAHNIIVAILIGGSSGLTAIGMTDMVHGFIDKKTPDKAESDTPLTPKPEDNTKSIDKVEDKALSQDNKKTE